MAEYIEREKVYECLNVISNDIEDIPEHGLPKDYIEGWQNALETAIGMVENIPPAADVRPERRGHVVWRERHSGGFRTVKCLYEFPDIIKENNIACKHIAKFDNRCTVKEPYCSECGKRLGDFINFCGNCGAKMDEKDGESDENR